MPLIALLWVAVLVVPRQLWASDVPFAHLYRPLPAGADMSFFFGEWEPRGRLPGRYVLDEKGIHTVGIDSRKDYRVLEVGSNYILIIIRYLEENTEGNVYYYMVFVISDPYGWDLDVDYCEPEMTYLPNGDARPFGDAEWDKGVEFLRAYWAQDQRCNWTLGFAKQWASPGYSEIARHWWAGMVSTRVDQTWKPWDGPLFNCTGRADGWARECPGGDAK